MARRKKTKAGDIVGAIVYSQMIDIEIIKQTVIELLDGKYKNAPINKLQDTFRYAEEDLKELVGRLIYQYVLNPKLNNKITQVTEAFFIYQSNPFSLTIAENPKSAVELIIALICEKELAKSTKEFTVDVRGFGKIRKVCLVVDSDIEFINTEHIITISREVYKTGYSWMLEYFREHLSKNETELSRSIYSYIRKILSGRFSDQLISQIWVAVTLKKSHSYIFDRLFIEDKIDNLNYDKVPLKESPAILISELLLRNLVYDESLASKSEKNQKALTAHLKDAPYYRLNNPLYEVAEEVFYSDKKIIVFPIVFGKPYKIFLYFPAEFEKEITPILEKHRNEIESILMKHVNKFRKIKSHMLETVGDSKTVQIIGQFCGGFIKAFFDM